MNNLTKKIMFLQSIAILSFPFIYSNICAKETSCCANLFEANGMITQNLTSLLNITETKIQDPKDIYSAYRSKDIKSWSSHPGIERWHLKLPENLKSNINPIINICENKLNMEKAILPKNNVNYDGVLFLGGTLNGVINRINFYNYLANKNLISPNLKVWVLTGIRKLDKHAGETEENFLKLAPAGQKILPLPKNELDMIKFVFHYKMPKETDVEYIYSPKDPHHTRATTESTVYAWVKELPKTAEKKYYLGLSNQPFVNYQESVINLALEKINQKNITVYVVGDKTRQNYDPDNYAAVLLDTVAKTMINCAEKQVSDTKQCLTPTY